MTPHASTAKPAANNANQQPEIRNSQAARFLGHDAGIGGPFALLGVTHDCGGAPQLQRALQRRLMQLARHPHASTPAADELRLELHTAAAQLTDPAVRDECAKRWPSGEPNAMPTAWRRSLSAVSPKLIRKARHVVGISGGWNSRAKKRLAMVARTHRVNAVDLVRALRPPQAANAACDARILGRPRELLLTPPTSYGQTWLLIHTALLVMLALVSALIARELLIVRPAAEALTQEAELVWEPTEELFGTEGAPPVREDVRHYAALEQELRNAVDDASRNPERSADRVIRAAGAFLDSWPDAPAETRERIAGLLSRYVRTAESPTRVAPLLETLTNARSLEDPRSNAAAAALSATIVPHLDATDPAYRSFTETVAPIRDQAVPDPASLDDLLLTALDRSARAVLDADPEWWVRWGACVDACGAAPETRRTAVILDAMERLLIQPNVRDWEKVSASLARRVAWRSGEPARVWLLDRFDDDRVTSKRLSELTLVLATDVSAPGVNLARVLAADADINAREELAREYRRVWLAERPEPSEAETMVLTALRDALEATPLPTPVWDRLRVIEQLASANAAAALLHAGKETEALEALDARTDPRASTPPAPTGGVMDAGWAVRLLSAETEEDAVEVLGEVGRRSLSQEAAEALVDAALRGPGRTTRNQARSMLAFRGDSAAVLLAMERAIDDRPSSSTMDLVADVLDVASGAPRDLTAQEARRLLLLAAGERIVMDGADTSGDHFGLLIQEHLARRADIRLTEPTPLSLSALVDRWAGGADVDDADRAEIDRTLRGMAGVSGGSGQLQAAYHRSLVELIAIGLSGSGGVARSWADRVTSRLDADWVNAKSATDQFLASQRAEARLWTLEMEGTP